MAAPLMPVLEAPFALGGALGLSGICCKGATGADGLNTTGGVELMTGLD